MPDEKREYGSAFKSTGSKHVDLAIVGAVFAEAKQRYSDILPTAVPQTIDWVTTDGHVFCYWHHVVG